MASEDEQVLSLDGVRLPCDDWVDVPGTEFQVRTYMHERAGTFHLRKKPDPEEDR
jgi:hypothetical protein